MSAYDDLRARLSDRKLAFPAGLSEYTIKTPTTLRGLEDAYDRLEMLIGLETEVVYQPIESLPPADPSLLDDVMAAMRYAVNAVAIPKEMME